MRRQLMIDGYTQPKLVPFVFDGVPEEEIQLDLSEFRRLQRVIADRYGRARKSDEVIRSLKRILIEVAFKHSFQKND